LRVRVIANVRLKLAHLLYPFLNSIWILKFLNIRKKTPDSVRLITWVKALVKALFAAFFLIALSCLIRIAVKQTPTSNVKFRVLDLGFGLRVRVRVRW